MWTKAARCASADRPCSKAGQQKKPARATVARRQVVDAVVIGAATEAHAAVEIAVATEARATATGAVGIIEAATEARTMTAAVRTNSMKKQ
jgi:adenosylcobinamide amidohydrolase